MKKQLALVLAVMMMLSLALTACGGGTTTSSSAPAPGSDAGTSAPAADNTTIPATKDLAVCIGPDPETIDPALNSAVDGATMIIHGFEGLLSLDKDGKVIPGQAESFTVSPDGLVYTFNLRKDLKWSDGSPLTANDFVYSWKRAVDPNTAAPYGEFFNVIKGFKEAADGKLDKLGIKAVDDNTFEITLGAPCGYFDQLCTFPTYAPVQKATVEANGDAWATDPKTYISNGPYRMIEWVPGQFIKYEKNPNYWNVAALGPDTIKFVLMEDGNAVLNAYQSGAIACAKDIPSNEIPTLSKRSDFHLDDLMGTYYISMNTNVAPFDNIKVRKALSLALDREYIANVAMQGTYSPAVGIVGPGLADAEAGSSFMDVTVQNNGGKPLVDTKANVEEAKKLLAEAGYPDGQGLPAIEYTTNDASYHKPVAEAMQQMFSAIGVQLNVQIAEWKTVTANRRNGNYQMARNGWVYDYNDVSSMLDLFVSTNGNNDGKYNNPKYDALMETARTSPDQAVRMKAMHEAEVMAIDDAAMLPLAYYKEFYMIKDNVKGFWHSPLGYFYFMYTTVE